MPNGSDAKSLIATGSAPCARALRCGDPVVSAIVGGQGHWRTQQEAARQKGHQSKRRRVSNGTVNVSCFSCSGATYRLIPPAYPQFHDQFDGGVDLGRASVGEIVRAKLQYFETTYYFSGLLVAVWPGSDPALTRARLEALRATLEEELLPFLHPGIESGW
ncbi:hypothetical protein AK812_SmicGene2512 [Symbiodinium microadriaticum]|uniref:Uncharacterized protein n=1 Tax=Symbiodinium microadriaticum TaxID=2951 RepID=A0A1Q9F190_SYMMI|nr:hypothetical protein AK812_SmicGene2512 [Symbiodinium microadriaticum]